MDAKKFLYEITTSMNDLHKCQIIYYLFILSNILLNYETIILVYNDKRFHYMLHVVITTNNHKQIIKIFVYGCGTKPLDQTFCVAQIFLSLDLPRII